MKMRIKPIILDVVEDDGMWLDKSTMTYYNKEQLEPIEELQELDEAAKKHMKDIAFDNELDKIQCIRDFKAGAQWMAEQGITCEGRVSSQQGKRGIVTTDVINDIGELMVSDKVTVLIKKK